MLNEEREQLIRKILDRDIEKFQSAQGDIIPDWMNMDLTMPQLKITLLLYWHRRMRMGDLAHILQKNISTATGIIDRLVEHKLVKREEDPEDRRVVVVSITDEGSELINTLWQTNRMQTRRVLEKLTNEELVIMNQAMDILYRAIRACEVERRESPITGLN